MHKVSHPRLQAAPTPHCRPNSIRRAPGSSPLSSWVPVSEGPCQVRLIMVAIPLMAGPCFAQDQAAAALGPQRRVLEGADKDRQREPQCGPLRAWRGPRHCPTCSGLKPRGRRVAESETAPRGRRSVPRPACHSGPAPGAALCVPVTLHEAGVRERSRAKYYFY